MNIGDLILGVNSVTVLYLIRYDTLLQNETDIITKCDNCFITTVMILLCDRSLLQNASGFLLQNVTVFLQITTILLQNATVITKCDVCYKLRQYSHSILIIISV